MEPNFDFNMYHVLVLGIAAVLYAAFPVEDYTKWIDKTFGAWLDKVMK